MAYPFANNQNAQGSHEHGNDYDYVVGQHPPTQFGTSAARFHQEPPYGGQGGNYEYEPSMVARDAQRDTSSVNAFDTRYPSEPQQEDVYQDEKAHDRASYPYGHSANMADTSPYTGKGIWTADDRRVMAKRSVPVRCFRTIFCVVVNAIIVIVSIVSLVVIFARPPNVGIGSIQTPDTSSVGVSGSAITLNGSVDFVVSNPNSISATLTNLKANIYDKVDESQAVGTGKVSDERIGPHSNTTITFPYQIRYDPTEDTSQTILKDLAQKCGLSGGSAQDLDLVLKVSSKISILSVPIPISFSQDISFTCPLTAATLKSLGADNIIGLFDGTTRKRGLQHPSDRFEL